MKQLKTLTISKCQNKWDGFELEDIHLNQIVKEIPLLEDLTLGCKYCIM